MKLIIENDIEFKDLYIPQSGRAVEDYQEDLLNISDVLKHYNIQFCIDLVHDGCYIKIIPQTIEIVDENMLQFFNDLLILGKYGFKYAN
jgi:hypothetical protein